MHVPRTAQQHPTNAGGSFWPFSHTGVAAVGPAWLRLALLWPCRLSGACLLSDYLAELHYFESIICECVFEHGCTISLLTSCLQQAVHASYITCLLLPVGCRIRGFHTDCWGWTEAGGVQDMAKRRERKEFEMLWRGARSFGDAADVFTSNWPSGKSRPQAPLAGSCCFSVHCSLAT